MKKIIFTFVAGIAMVASADVLYWMVDNPLEIDGVQTTWTSAAFFQESTQLSKWDAEDMSDFGYATANIDRSVAGYDSASYFIELYNDQNAVIAKSSAIAYSSIANSFFSPIASPSSITFQASAGSFSNVPEPTSGLLFLIGGVLLGLKRRRMA